MKELSVNRLVNLTTAQRDALASPSSGMQIFNSTDGSVEIYDGTNWIADGGLPQEFIAGLHMFIGGSVQAGTRIAMQLTNIETTFPIGIPGSKAYAYDAPTVEVVFNIIKEASNAYGTKINIGTITFPIGNSVGSFSFVGEVILAVDDMLYVESPANTGAMGDLFINIKGKSAISSY
jgi:hypothetical protein